MTVTFYKGRDNDASLTLKSNGAAFQPANVTKIELNYGSGSVDSATSPDLFSFTQTDIKLKLGGLDIPAGTYSMTVIIYTSASLSGIVWGDPLSIKLIEE
jgi:hypothetical protein